jgi:hypothetical protein
LLFSKDTPWSLRPDAHHDLLYMLGACMGQGDAVAEAGGVEAFAGEDFVVETLEIGHVGMTVEQMGDLVQRRGALRALHVQRDAGRVEKLGESASHG